jgi:Kef-type K+ transport system membrane component KefB
MACTTRISFLSAFIYLATAVLMVPLAHRLGLGSVLGYLIGGAVIGPFALGWVGGTQGEEAMHFAEFGVVIMLFMIGLELEPARLWRMRGPIFGLGGLQVSGTALAVMGAAMAFGLECEACARRRHDSGAVIHRHRDPDAAREGPAAQRCG